MQDRLAEFKEQWLIDSPSFEGDDDLIQWAYDEIVRLRRLVGEHITEHACLVCGSAQEEGRTAEAPAKGANALTPAQKIERAKEAREDGLRLRSKPIPEWKAPADHLVHHDKHDRWPRLPPRSSLT